MLLIPNAVFNQYVTYLNKRGVTAARHGIVQVVARMNKQCQAAGYDVVFLAVLADDTAM